MLFIDAIEINNRYIIIDNSSGLDCKMRALLLVDEAGDAAWFPERWILLVISETDDTGDIIIRKIHGGAGGVSGRVKVDVAAGVDCGGGDIQGVGVVQEDAAARIGDSLAPLLSESKQLTGDRALAYEGVLAAGVLSSNGWSSQRTNL